MNQISDSLDSTADGTKRFTTWHIEASSAARMNEEVLERQERRRSKEIFVCLFVCVFALVSLLAYFVLFSFVCVGLSRDVGEYMGWEPGGELNWCVMM